MAAEKQHDSRQSIVDQDAAITAYLDGLLRDPEADGQPEASAPRRAPGLKVINVPEEAPVAADATPAPAAPVEQPADEGETGAASDVTAEFDDVAESDLVEAAGAESRPMEAESSVETVDEASAPVESAAEETTSEPATADHEPEATAVPAEPEAPAEPVQDDRWAWLRVGGMTMAVPAGAVASRHADPVLDPVPGAPAHVAGALNVDGRPRLILSLATLTGLRERDNAAREVFLLGKGGLWGVVGERVDQPPALDDEAVEWRSESQKAGRRPWLSGTASAMGVAVLDETGLRAALRASR
ncbi:hypothetical protein GM160_02725 [Guyparkeria halophila]|uniref:CheW-like domain-containing protein n=1 Tax=Guyparkeria halophila TaxID=47960 RepID=A0A6I6CZ29_9GAMM|nr:chemotaxis protein CheW [Guyparkeria halophila]QGT77898.1 hypothetical protein GM160_02725 [Guyparkeria halophila]